LSSFFLEPDAFWNAILWKSALRWALYLFLTNYGPLQILKDVGTLGICVIPSGYTKGRTLNHVAFLEANGLVERVVEDTYNC
jgi:hypothetical protein